MTSSPPRSPAAAAGSPASPPSRCKTPPRLLTVGADRILFASDYPYEMATDAARWIETAPISENDRRKICYSNAAALFGLPPSRRTEGA
jgi:predicted TIM-barrel fold metal-dependent hydrolase